MNVKKIEYTNGTTEFLGEVYRDENQAGTRPGVVVFPEAFGLNDHARERAQRLARLGYVALAADLHGGGEVFSDMEQLRPRMEGLFANRSNWRSMARAALDALLAQPEVDPTRVAAIGFCFGGATCLELARTGVPLAAIVTFHAGLVPEVPEDQGKIQAKVLVCHGSEDPLLQKEVIDAIMDEFRRDKVDWQFTYYGNAVHSFTDPDADKHGMPGLAYDARTEARSWTAMQNLFSEIF